MLKRLKERATELELMDDFTMGGAELREALRQLRVLNRIFAAAAPTLYGVHRLWAAADKPKRFSVLDIGSGSGDVNRSLLRWADENGIELCITLADITDEACEEARLLYRGEPRINVMRRDLFELPSGCADVITGTQFLHHFEESELPCVVNRMLAASRIGVVINDIHRHWMAWAAVWLATRVLSRNRYIVNDGPLSVAKGFRKEDWQQLRHELSGTAEMLVAWRPLFRYAVILWRS
ncbi:methyltransferase domain-containing protein [Paenibacillus sp. R14(2021)]|uniref:methyltransferase domain-containing protein n=1 Tax=Paenibacillus sp. R14(2021) TaxID=2859228 RepID=UPI001C61367C|nr:methyltransferase domain-containing protein [Paenibacillus sp. R14(2021)]